MDKPEQVKEIVEIYVIEYNEQRLHGGISYVTPSAKLLGKDVSIFAERKKKLVAARIARKEIWLNQGELADHQPMVETA